MKRLLLTLISVLMLIAVFAATPYKVTASKLNVRNQPNTSGAIMGSLSSSAVVDVVSIKNGWAEIRYNGQKAYISAQYLTPTSGNVTSSTSKNTSSSGKGSSTSSKGADVSYGRNSGGRGVVSGFHASIGAMWTMHTAKAYANDKWQYMRLGKHNAVMGASAGVGLEYNGIVHHGQRVNIMLGVRSGIYYQWYGSKKLKPQDLLGGSIDDYYDYDDMLWAPQRAGIADIDLDDFDLGDISDLFGGGSGEQADFKYVRRSYHVIDVPLQFQFSLEWTNSRGKQFGAGVFTGPIFEFIVANNTVTAYTDNDIILDNAISGKSRWLKGGDGEDLGDAEPKAYRESPFNMQWGVGAFIQFGKFRLVFESDFAMIRHKMMRGGDVKGKKIDPAYGSYSRPAVIGFQVVF